MVRDSSLDHGGNALNDKAVEESEFGVMDNPYYDDGGDIELSPTGKSQNNIDLNDVKLITPTHNVYYEMLTFLTIQIFTV